MNNPLIQKYKSYDLRFLPIVQKYFYDIPYKEFQREVEIARQKPNLTFTLWHNIVIDNYYDFFAFQNLKPTAQAQITTVTDGTLIGNLTSKIYKLLNLSFFDEDRFMSIWAEVEFDIEVIAPKHIYLTCVKCNKLTVRRRNTDKKQTYAFCSKECLKSRRHLIAGQMIMFKGKHRNGQLTKPQQILADTLNLPTEFKILTRDVYGMFDVMPRFYKVDLASPEHKVAIEVDGRSHLFRERKYLDRKKEKILSELGWKVLRVKNEQVLNSTAEVTNWIQGYLQ